MCTIIRCMYLYVISSIHCRYVGVTIGTYDKHLTDEFDRARDSSKVCVCFFSSELTASFYLVQNTRVQRLFGASLHLTCHYTAVSFVKLISLHHTTIFSLKEALTTLCRLQKENEAHKRKMKGGAFRLNMHPRSYFDENPYRSDRPMGSGKKPTGMKREVKPFKPSSPGKLVGFWLKLNN